MNPRQVVEEINNLLTEAQQIQINIQSMLPQVQGSVADLQDGQKLLQALFEESKVNSELSKQAAVDARQDAAETEKYKSQATSELREIEVSSGKAGSELNEASTAAAPAKTAKKKAEKDPEAPKKTRKKKSDSESEDKE